MAKRRSQRRRATKAGAAGGAAKTDPDTTAGEPAPPEDTPAPEPKKSGPRGRRPRAEGDTAQALARLHVWQVQTFRDLLVFAAVVAIVWAGYALRAVTVPLLVALMLAYLFEPLIEKLCKHPKIKRTSAVTGLVAAVAIGTLIVFGGLAIPLVGQTKQLVEDVRGGEMRTRIARLAQYVPDTYQPEFKSFLDVLPAGDDLVKPSSVDPMTSEVEFPEPDESEQDEASPSGGVPAGAGDAEDATSEVTPPPDAAGGAAGAADEGAAIDDAVLDERVRAALERLRPDLTTVVPVGTQAEPEGLEGWIEIARGNLRSIVAVFTAILKIGLVAFLIPFYFFFFSLWYPVVIRFGRELLPRKNRTRALVLLRKMDAVVAGFVRGRIVISAIMGVLLAVGWMACGVPYAILLGLIVGVFCAVPYLGIIGIPAAVGLLFFRHVDLPESQQWSWWVIILVPSAWFAVVQLIEGYVLTPAIAGKATNLDPVTILVAVLAGGSVLGVYGMLLAIPLAACGKILLTEILLPHIKQWTRGERADPLPIERE